MRTRQVTFTFSMGLLAAWLATTGCSSAKKSEVPYLSQLTPVTGSVKLDGKPTEYVMVTFHPVDDGGGEKYTAYATTDSAGVFKPATPPGGSGNDLEKYAGMLPGKYKVTLSCWKLPDGKPFDPVTSDVGPMNVGAVELIPEKYNSPATTPLQVEVAAGQSTPIDFDLKLK